MKVPVWTPPEEQMCQLGRHHWSVARLQHLARELPVLSVPLDHLAVYYKYEGLRMRDFVMHMRAVLNADLKYPIILDEDGEVMDGRHRIMRAMLEDRGSILAVRFQTNPPPCRVTD